MRTLRIKADALSVDRETGIIRGCAVVTAMEAKGHGYALGMDGVKAVADAINSPDGLPVNFTHQSQRDMDEGKALATRVGLLRNARIEGQTCRADVHLSQAAKVSPQGNLWDFLLSLAEEQPKHLGLSIVFLDAGFETRENKRFIKIGKISSVDFVDNPAANPTGLLQAKVTKMEMILEWAKSLGYDGDGTPEDVLGFLKGKMPTDSGETTEDTDTQMNSANGEAVRLAVAGERTRLAELQGIARQFKLNEAWAINHAKIGTPVESARVFAAETAAMRQDGLPMTTIHVGEDRNRSTLRAGMVDALCLRIGTNLKDAHPRALEFRGRRLFEMARILLDNAGVSTAGMGPAQLFEECKRNRHMLAQSSSDFDNLLRDAANKSLLQAWSEMTPDWQKFARRGTAKDFKTKYLTGLELAPSLTSRKEGAGITYSTLTDRGNTLQLAEYVSGIKLTRQALINDDLDAFNAIPQMQAGAARRLEDDVAYAAFVSNPAMPDGENLFSAAHNNHITSGNAGPSVTQFSTMATLIATQTSNGATLNLRPRFILCPWALSFACDQVINSTADPAGGNSGVNNPARGRFEVIANARLDAEDAGEYYMVCGPEAGTVEVCFLEDEPAPVLRQEVDFDTEDVKFAVRHTVAAKVIDYRGWCKNEGA